MKIESNAKEWSWAVGLMATLLVVAVSTTVPAMAEFDWRDFFDNDYSDSPQFDFGSVLDDFKNDLDEYRNNWNNGGGYGYDDNSNPFDLGGILDDLRDGWGSGNQYGYGSDGNNNSFDLGGILDGAKNGIQESLDKAKSYLDDLKNNGDGSGVIEPKNDLIEGFGKILGFFDDVRNGVSNICKSSDSSAYECDISGLVEGSKDKMPDKAARLIEIWNEIPEPAKNFLIENTKESLLVPVPYKDEYGNTDVKFIVVGASPLEGKVYAYEQSKNEVVTMFTNDALGYVTGGAVSVDDVKTLEVRKVGANQYEIQVEAQVNLFGIIPVPMQSEIVVDKEEGDIDGDVQVVSVEKPWWSALTF